MNSTYCVGFKDVYPWVWSVMLGVALTLAERRGAFQTGGVQTYFGFWLKNVAAAFLNLILPALVFGATMLHLGPRYGGDMGFWQILGALYLAGVPLGTHHLWLILARKCRWLFTEELLPMEQHSVQIRPFGSIVYVMFAFGIPTLAVLVGWRVPF
jgi:hypothetical protein